MASISVAGDTSGTITIAAPAVAGSGTLTLPVATDTLAGIAATQTLTNKTLGAGTVFPAGAVLQVVNGTCAVYASNSSSTYVTTGLTATITPSSATSKVLVSVNINGTQKANNTALALRLYRGASSITGIEGIGMYTGGLVDNAIGSCSTSYLDAPSTTSATTYTVYFSSTANIAAVRVQNYYTSQSDSVSTITLMEIQG